MVVLRATYNVSITTAANGNKPTFAALRTVHDYEAMVNSCKKDVRFWSGSFFTYICSHFTTAFLVHFSIATHVYVISTETEAKISHGSINFPLLPPLRNN